MEYLSICLCHLWFHSVQFSCSVMSDSLRPHESQHARPPCPSPTSGVYSNSCPLSQWCHPTISSSVGPFSSCPQSLPASGSFPMSQLFTWGGQSIGVSASASVLPMNTQDWSPLGWTDTYRVHYKELDYTVMEVGKSKICKVYQWSKRPTESCFSLKAVRQKEPESQMKSEGHQLENSLYFEGGSVF